MNKNIEKELKLLVNKEEFDTLATLYEPLTFIKQLNVYYDTKNQDIRNQKGAMRIRSKNNKHIFTLKMHKGEDLLEFECEVEDNSIANLNKEEILTLLKEYNITGPFITTAKLTTYRAMYIDEDAELCFDKNEYNNTIDYEIEYEYKRDHDGITKFNSILKKANLHYEKNCLSKIARALQK